jgi:hypothetical protein
LVKLTSIEEKSHFLTDLLVKVTCKDTAKHWGFAVIDSRYGFIWVFGDAL